MIAACETSGMFSVMGQYVGSHHRVPLHIMDSRGLCHWYSQLTPESYVIDTPADVGWRLDFYIFDMSANTGWAEDLWCIQRAIWCPVVWHLDHPVCIGVYCWTRKLCCVAFQLYNMHNVCMCMLLDEPMGQSFRKTLINEGGTLLHLTCVCMLLDKLMGQHFAEM